MPMPTPSLAANTPRFASVTVIVTMPVSSLEIATVVTSGAVPESPDASPNEPVFAAKATPLRTNAPATTSASARHVDPFITASVAENLSHVTARFPPAPRRRRRLARPSRVPRAPEELPPRRGTSGQRAARLFQLHRPALAVRAAARGARRLGLARHADLPARAVRRLPGGPRLRRRPARAARPAA